jgi:hypothetical protein
MDQIIEVDRVSATAPVDAGVPSNVSSSLVLFISKKQKKGVYYCPYFRTNNPGRVTHILHQAPHFYRKKETCPYIIPLGESNENKNENAYILNRLGDIRHDYSYSL